MKSKKPEKRRWFCRILFGSALALDPIGSLLHAQDAPMAPTASIVSVVADAQPTEKKTVDNAARPLPTLNEVTTPALDPIGGYLHSKVASPAPTASIVSVAAAAQPTEKKTVDETAPPLTILNDATTPIGDPFAPAWVDPVSRVPNFFGGFVARGSQACRNTFSTQNLNFTGAGGEGFESGKFVIKAPLTVVGPLGPYTLNQSIPYPVGPTTFSLPQNNEMTALVQGNFPDAAFVNGGGTNLGRGDLTFFYNYLFTTGQNVCVNLLNPSGGGAAGRNLYFDNGSALPRDRVYFFNNYVRNFQGLATPFDLNRYVFGVEKSFLDNLCSIEVRVPFAGTANADQVAGQGLAVNNTQFGNLGIVLKGVLVRTPNLVASLGLGVSLPTADDSRMLIGNSPVVVIQNRTCLLQPLFGVAWAPNDRFYSQFGLQFDIDPTGNPVQSLDANGNFGRVGRLHDQAYAYLHGSVGYWIYQNDLARLTGIALQSELHYYRSFGRHDSVVNGPVTVTDLMSDIDVLNGNVGFIFRFGDRTTLSASAGFPLAGDPLYNWNAMAQVNFQYGTR